MSAEGGAKDLLPAEIKAQRRAKVFRIKLAQIERLRDVQASEERELSQDVRGL